MKFLVLVTIALSSLACLSLGGEKVRNCQVIFLDLPRNAPREFEMFDGAESQKISLHGRNVSQMITLPGGELQLSLSLDHVIKPLGIPEGAPTLKVATETNDFYLLVLSDPENKVIPLRLELVGVGEEQRKAGRTLWINLSDHAIKGKFGDKTLVIPAKGRELGEPPLPESGYYLAEFLYQKEGKGEFLPIMKKSWWFDARKKNISFIIDAGSRLPKTFTFEDKLSSKKVN